MITIYFIDSPVHAKRKCGSTLWPLTLQVSPTMCAEELTNQVLFMRNVPVGDEHMWMAFEAVEDGQLGEGVVRLPKRNTWPVDLTVCVLASERPLHPKEKVLEQVLQWCKMADPTSPYLVVKSVPKGQGINILTCTCVWVCVRQQQQGCETWSSLKVYYCYWNVADCFYEVYGGTRRLDISWLLTREQKQFLKVLSRAWSWSPLGSEVHLVLRSIWSPLPSVLTFLLT